MPPGHGKSYRHGVGRLREADVLCPPKSEGLLVDLKRRARKNPSEWPAYVSVWASRLRARAAAGDVVMVPDVDVAVAAGFTVVGAFLLDEDVWASNLAGRSAEAVARCRECYQSVQSSGVVKYLCSSNEELTGALEMCCRLVAR